MSAKSWLIWHWNFTRFLPPELWVSTGCHLNFLFLITLSSLYPNPKIPDYKLELIEEIIENPSDFGIYRSGSKKSTIKDTVTDKQSQKFFRWMNGSSKYIGTYNEEEDIKDELEDENLDLTFSEFTEIREDSYRTKSCSSTTVHIEAVPGAEAAGQHGGYTGYHSLS